MRINEVEHELGITRANVRFYEREGLVDPERDANGYRNYSEADVERLRQVLVLRKLGMPVADIKGLLDGDVSLQEEVGQNIDRLEDQIEELNGALRMCRQIKAEGVQMDTFDAAAYWDAINEQEAVGGHFASLASDAVNFELDSLSSWFDTGTREDALGTRLGKFALELAGVIAAVGLTELIFSGDFRSFGKVTIFLLATLGAAMLVLLVVWLAGRRSQKAGQVVMRVLMWIAILVFVVAVGGVLVLLLNDGLHFLW